MSAADNKKRVLEFYDKVMAARSVDLIAEYCAKDCVEHSPPPIPGFQQGLEGVKAMMGMWFNAFPDLKVEAKQIIAEGDYVSAVIEWSGTHKGSIMGEEPTGKSVTGKSIDFMKVENGMMTEHWGWGNDPEVFGELGIKPPSE